MQDITGPRLAQTTSQEKLQPTIRENPFPEGTLLYQGKKSVILLILDGWGIGPKTAGNAIELAKTPTMDQLWTMYPHTQLEASGKYVGLPEGVDGNSETGHMNIGAGSVVLQSLPRVDKAIEDGSFFQSPELLAAIAQVKKNNSALHVMGLVGPGFVHSNVAHLYALLDLAKQHSLQKVFVHAFTDGRDASPTSGLSSLEMLEKKMAEIGVGQLASITGRFYAMDRDRNWDRTQVAYDALVLGKGEETQDWRSVMTARYEEKVSDEYMKPIIILNEQRQKHVIEDGDAAVFFNFRVDRPRQLAWALAMEDFEYRNLMGSTSGQPVPEDQRQDIQTFQRQKVVQDLHFVSMTDYDSDFMVPKVFPQIDIEMNLGKALFEAKARQLRLTETEKTKMVTYYINGRKDEPYPGEKWITYPSKKTETYADIPEMDAVEITDELLRQIEAQSFDGAVVNICNGDMVGHTGDLQAGIRACEVVDQQVARIVAAVLKTDGVVMITADHGNIEEMIDNETGEVDTSHSTYPVPLIIVSKEGQGNNAVLPKGILADLAPTMLRIMGIEKPAAMTGRSLV